MSDKERELYEHIVRFSHDNGINIGQMQRACFWIVVNSAKVVTDKITGQIEQELLHGNDERII